MDVSGQLHAPPPLPPEEIAPGTHWLGVWVSPRAGLDAVARKNKSHYRPLSRSEPRSSARSIISTLAQLTRLHSARFLEHLKYQCRGYALRNKM